MLQSTHLTYDLVYNQTPQNNEGKKGRKPRGANHEKKYHYVKYRTVRRESNHRFYYYYGYY